jgi:hypothetical protein
MVAGKSNRPEEPRHSALLHASKIRETRNEDERRQLIVHVTTRCARHTLRATWRFYR